MSSAIVDAMGNVYTTGLFSGTVDMDPGSGVYNITSAGQNDIYINKLDANGNFVWAKRIGDLMSDNCRYMNIDASGNIYITGFFLGTIDFDPGPAVFNLVCSSTNSAAYLLKMDSNGNFVWAKKIAETVHFNAGNSIAIAASGNVYLTGIFEGTADFDPGPAVFNMTSVGTTNADIYIAKFDNNGNFIWANQFSGANGESVYAITLDATENIYTTGVFYGTCDFDPGAAVFNLTAPVSNSSDIFVSKLDGNGNFIFAKQIGGVGTDYGRGIALDPSGNILVTGDIEHLVDFDPGPGTFFVDAAFYSDAFVLKLTSNGDFIWVKTFPGISGAGASRGFTTSVDDLGYIYTMGDLAFGVDFDPGPSVYPITSIGSNDTYISKLDPNGNFVFALSFGGGSFTVGSTMRIDALHNIYAGGSFIGISDFDPTSAVFNLTASGQSNSFILKLSQCLQPSFSTITDTACFSYTINNQTYTTSGTYTQTLINALGCDSIITLNLSIGGLVVTSAITACNSYTWQGQAYTSSGNYSVMYTDRFGCDSSYNLNLTINHNVLTTINTSICEGQIYAGHSTTGTYVDTYTAANGCDSIRTLNLIVRPKAYATINATICEGQNYEGYTISGTFTDTYPASNGCDSIRTLLLRVNPRSYFSKSVSICQGEFYYAGNANQTTSGIYRDTISNSFGCDSVITTNLIVNPNPIPDLGQDKSICSQTSVILNPGSFNSYLWQDMSTQPSFSANTIGQYWVKVKNSFNCTASDTINILSINNSPTNFLKKIDSICSGKDLTIKPISNFTSYLWSTGSSNNNISVQSPGKYWLKVMDVNGCFGNDTINVIPKNCFSEIYFPNAFTPNGDGKNDFFKVAVYGNLVSFSLQIFNRYGQLVFQSTDFQKGWDGFYKGGIYASGVFTWQCKYQLVGKLITKEKGTIVLIR